MVLFLLFGDQGLKIGAVSARETKWFRSAGRDPYPALGRFIDFRGKRSVKAVVCGLADGPDSAWKASWSTVRAAVAMANALALAWGVPVASLPVSGQENESELAEAARRVGLKAKGKGWIRAKYSGQPNITKPKKRF
jgi:hypothetical protein